MYSLGPYPNAYVYFFITMNDVANILLAAGGRAVMAQDEQEAADITTFCQGTLLNTGVPDEAKIRACLLILQ